MFILASLAEHERHGYSISRDVEQLSNGRIRLSAGTLYGALNRLCDEELVAATKERIVDGRRRRYYRLTAQGQRALAAEVEQLHSTAKTLSGRLAPRARRPRLT